MLHGLREGNYIFNVGRSITAKNREKLAQEKVRKAVPLLIIGYEVQVQKLFPNIEFNSTVYGSSYITILKAGLFELDLLRLDSYQYNRYITQASRTDRADIFIKLSCRLTCMPERVFTVVKDIDMS